MSIRTVLRSQICADVPKRWAEQYRNHRDAKEVITYRLGALMPHELTPETINGIIGNDSWTHNKCDECGQDRDVLFRLGDEPDYDARWLDLCADCLQGAARFALTALTATDATTKTGDNDPAP